MATTITRFDLGAAPRVYEFDDGQNQLLTRLTATMRLVGFTTVTLGLGLCCAGLWISTMMGLRFAGSRTLLLWVAGSWPHSRR